MASRTLQSWFRARVRFLLYCMLLGSGDVWGSQSDSSQGPGIEQRIGERISLELPFRDELGNPVTLREAAGGKPSVLALVYYRCPMLCNQVISGLLESLLEISSSAGEQFNVITLSFDPTEGPDLASAKREQYLKAYGHASARSGWRFLTGTPESISVVCRETGFRTVYDPATRLYGHASALLILTPDGRISRYLFGVRYPARELRLSLVEASSGKIGTRGEQILLLCMRYDPSTGKYTLAVNRLLKVAAGATLLGLAFLVYRLTRKEKRTGNPVGVPHPGRVPSRS